MEEETLEFYDPWTCTGCGGKTRKDTVNLAIWSPKGLVAIEGVPAYVCDACEEQTYDDAVATELRQLASANFPRDRVVREIQVPVFMLTSAADGEQKS